MTQDALRRGKCEKRCSRTALPDALAEGRRKAASALDEGGHAD